MTGNCVCGHLHTRGLCTGIQLDIGTGFVPCGHYIYDFDDADSLIAQLVAAAPRLTGEQKYKISVLLYG